MKWYHQIIRLEYDMDATTRLVIVGRVVRQWAPADFMGWGHPLAFLFVTTGEWMIRPEDGAE